jgi:hypothetical protein
MHEVRKRLTHSVGSVTRRERSQDPLEPDLATLLAIGCAGHRAFSIGHHEDAGQWAK